MSIPNVYIPQPQVPFIDIRTGLIDRTWYRFLEAQWKYIGTMANQAADAVEITGGTIDGTVIGGTDPAAATFTTLAITSGAILPSTYTPTLTNVTNIDDTGSTLFQVARLGDVAFASGRITVNPTAGAGTATEVGISLPYASTISIAGQCSGTATTVSNDVAAILGDTSNNRAALTFDSGFTNNRSFYVFFMYRIV